MKLLESNTYDSIESLKTVISLQTLNRTDSMVSLCFRSLAGFVNDDNLPGLQSFLESKQVQVDDRDEVSPRLLGSCCCYYIIILL